MADTVIPPPNPFQKVQQTFTPAPVPAPAPTTNPTAVSPTAAGVAAPGVQPTSPSTAPAANGLAGAPNPTVAGNSPATQAKESLGVLATPAPLPEAAKPAPAAPAATAPGAAPVKPAAGGAGAGGAGSTPAAGGGSTAKAGTTAKTGTSAALDVLSPVNDTIKKMLEGEDPIAKIQFNQILTGNGPRNQAVLQGMRMKLQQNNLDGQGAGDALLAMMARDAEFKDSDLRAAVSADSAKRLYDMNVHGFDKAIEIQQERDRLLRSDLSAALANGQLGAAKELFGEVFPGIPFDEAAAKAASPQATANFNSRMKLVDQFVSQGNAEQAKAVFEQLAKDMPEMFGFPNDPAGAQAALAGVDFGTEAWQANLEASNKASAAARTAALQGDMNALSTSVDQIFAKMTPAAIEGMASSAAKSRSLEEINQILEASGMAPVASSDEAAMLDKTKFAKAVKSYDLMKASKRDVVDGLLDTFAKADPAIAIDPAARQAAKAWLAMHAYGIATDPESGAVTNFTLDDKATPPWDASSPQAYMFMDWPVASFNPDGTVAQRSYNGMTPYGDEYKPGDLTTAKGREDQRLDKAYEQYVFSTDPAERLDMNKWYYATAGGQKPADAKLLTGSLKTEPVVEPKKDPMVLAKEVTDAIAKGTALTPEQIEIAKTENLIQKVTTAGKGAQGVIGPRVSTYLQAHPDGNLLMDGKLVQLKRGFEVAQANGAEIVYNGKTYFMVDHDGRVDWFLAQPKAGSKYKDADAIPSPLK